MKLSATNTDLVPITAPSTPAAESAFRKPGAVSRRAVLAGMLALGVGAYLDLSPLTSWTAYAAPAKSPVKVTAGSTPTPPTPYAITASSELSDDVFATSDVLIGADDRLLPFYNPNSQVVEALVLSGTSLLHLYRDPTQATGWAYDDFDLQQTLTSVTDIAIAANNDRVYALLVGEPDPTNNPAGSPYWLTWLDATSPTWSTGYAAPIDDDSFPPDPGPMKGGISRQGVPYFYTTAVNGSSTTLHGWVTSTVDASQPLTPQEMATFDSSSISDYLVLYDTGDSGVVGYAFILTPYEKDGLLSVYQQQGTGFSTTPMSNVGSSGVDTLLWAWASPNSTSGIPGYAFQGNIPSLGGEGTFFADESGTVTNIADLPAKGDNSVAVWLQDDQYTVNLLDSNGTLHTIQQTGPGAFADPMPISNGVPGSVTPGLVTVSGVPTDPTRATLFAVGADETLSVLSLDDAGWNQTQLHQDHVVGVQLTSYRVKITVRDANGTPVRYAQAQIGTDRPVGLWQDIGSTIITPAATVTMTADILGEISFSVPAEELDAAVLTVQALDGSGNATGSAVSVTADYDVRNFMGGTAALDNVGSMSASTLQTAKNPDGTNLLPGLDQTSAGNLAGSLSQAVTAGQGAPPASDAVHAMRMTITGKKGHRRVTMSTSHDALAFGVPPNSQVQGSLSHLFHTIGHAIRHGLAEVKSATIRWATDLKNWVIDLATTISDLATYAINDMRDAFHVIGGWFATLGADIKAVVSWLKREVLEFLSDVGKNATTIEGVIGNGPTDLTTVIGGIEKKVAGWFVQQEETVGGWITDLQTDVEDAVFGSSQPPDASPSDTGSSSALNSLSKDVKWISKVVNDSPGKWLYDKLMQHLPHTDGPDMSGVFDKAIDDLATAFEGSVDVATGVVHLLWTSVQDLTTKGKLTEAKVSDWFAQLSQQVKAVLQLCDKIVNTVLDFVTAALSALDKYLTYQWSLVSISPILKFVLDKLGIDPTISLNRLVSLVTAFPLTLVRDIRGEDAVFTPSQSARERKAVVGDGQNSAEELCYGCAAILQVLWTAADVVGDFETLAEEGDTQRPEQEGIIDYFDILCPLAENILLLPGRSNELIFNGLPTNVQYKGLIAPSVLTAIVVPCMKIAQKAKLLPGTGTEDDGVIQYYEQAPAQPNPVAQYYGPVVSMIAALANTVMASYYGDKNGTSKGAIAESILCTVFGNLSNVAAPLTTWWLNASLEDVPVAVKIIIDGVGGLGAGTIYAVQAWED